MQLRGCVWAWRGCREARNARRARVPVAALRYRLAPPATSVGNPVCVCVCLCATQPGAGCGVWVRLVRRLRGRRASPVRRYTAGGGPPPAAEDAAKAADEAEPKGDVVKQKKVE